MNFSKLIMWIMNAFFWGIGIYTASLLVDVISGVSDNLIIRILIIIILGGVVMHFYHIINDKENYIKTYKNIIKD